MGKGYTHMSKGDISLAKKWSHEGVGMTNIAGRLGRSKGTISKNVRKTNAKTKPKGQTYATAFVLGCLDVREAVGLERAL